jgi:hypothetical protein
VSKDGEKHDGGDDKHDGEKRSFQVGESAKGMLELLFPGLKEEDVGESVTTPAAAADAAGSCMLD